ncbi:MAG TPA: glycosyltransferase family A protein, partial [Kiritimatiellia bacterium]|nr:glycosyltransferase family A protein [Kiritimatiellia bacterium]
MEQPLVTAILCTYNRESYLREALDSILAQTYPNIEVLVIDDGSSNAGMFRI